MKIGIIYDDIIRNNLDCRFPNKGNPGVGGTQFCYLMLIYYLVEKYPEVQIYVYRYKEKTEKVLMPKQEQVVYRKAKNLQSCVHMAADEDVNVLVFTFSHVIEIAPIIERRKINSVVWIHNWIRGDVLRTISNCSYIRRAVFLVREHYDRYFDDEVIGKSVFIPNMFNTYNYKIRNADLKNVVTYVGAIIPSKGFHVLAKAWKDVVNSVPDAELFVIGKGNLYEDSLELGTLGLAEKSYEDSFSHYLMDDEGKVLSSVHLMGILGAEKADIYGKTKVGIVNPTGRTEVCPISALEMEAAGIPVVSKNTNGLPDVVLSESTGLLINKEKDLASSIIRLLKEEEVNKAYSINARKFVEENFSPNVIAKTWFDLFEDVLKNKNVCVLKPVSNFKNNYKWLRVLNYYIKKVPLFKNNPSLVSIEGKISKMIRHL